MKYLHGIIAETHQDWTSRGLLDIPELIRLVSIVLMLILVAGITGAYAQSQASKISGYVMGHAGFVYQDPFKTLFMRDPSFTYTLYPLPPDLSNRDKRKLDRVYYPRTRTALTEGYDLIVFHDARFQHFTSRQVSDLDWAFRDGGMTDIMVFMGSFLWDWIIEPTTLREVIPISGHSRARYGSFRVVFREDRDDVFLPFVELGIEKVMGNAIAEMTAKQGATIWGDIVPQNQPWMVSWVPGGRNPGIQWVLIQWYLEGWWSEKNNPYALDVATNMIFYSLDRPLISDIHARREARQLFTTMQAQKSVIVSMLEWAHTFGGNTQALWNRVNGLEEEMQEAYDSYLNQDYESTISFMDSMSQRVSEISDDAVRLKEEAMFWVFVSEWLAVTSTGIIAGVVVWSFMVRRRIYSPVEATKLRRI